jgi:hypothetical protein
MTGSSRRRTASVPPPGSVIAPAIFRVRLSSGSAQLDVRVPQDRDDGSRPSSSSAPNAPSRRSSRRLRKCTYRASRPARSRRSSRSRAATLSRPPPLPPSTSAWARASTSSPAGRPPNPFPIRPKLPAGNFRPQPFKPSAAQGSSCQFSPQPKLGGTHNRRSCRPATFSRPQSTPQPCRPAVRRLGGIAIARRLLDGPVLRLPHCLRQPDPLPRRLG